MARTFGLIYLVFLFGSHAVAQSRLLVGRVLNAGSRPSAPVGQAKVTLVDTNQEALTDANGRFQFALRAALGAGFEVQIAVKAGNLRIYLPRNGVLLVPAPGTRPVEVQLLPAGSKLFLEPAAIEALLAQAAKPPATAARNNPGQPAEREPRLKRFLEQWAVDYGFSLEDVEREVKGWGDQVRAKRENASLRQRALAEFQAQHFAEAAALFEESANAEAAALEKIEGERKERDLEERAVLRRFLDDKIRAAESLTQGLQYEQAARVLEVAAKRVDRGRYADFWAEMQARWGLALNDMGSSGEAAQSIASLRTAVTAYQNALQVRKKEFLPQDWAGTQNNLGNVYRSLGERLSGAEAAESLRAAVTVYRNALQVYTKESLPQDWARTQNNLGNAYSILGERLSGTEGAESLRAAVTAFQNALQVRTKESLPQDWARTQNNLGNAYLIIGERLSGMAGVESLRAAVTAFQNALQVRTKESFPQAWARTQNNLGNAYSILGERLSGTEGAESLRAAVTAYQNALQVFTKESLAQAWAGTQNNLGNVYRSLGERLSGTEGAESLRAAVTAFQSALEIRTRESLPQDWAMTQNNLGVAYEGLGERQSGTEGAESLRDAVTAFQNALQVYTNESFPQDWARTQNNLAKTFALQEKWEEAAQATENVLTLYPRLLEGLVRAEGIYHNRLFRFDRAFELNARRVELGEGELDFIEKHLTTALFAACATRASALEAKISEKDQRQVLTALRFACLSAEQKTEDARAAGRQLRQQIAGLDKVRWTLSGTEHFVSQHAAFAAKSADWVRLFDALEQGDEAKARAALTALGVPE